MNAADISRAGARVMHQSAGEFLELSARSDYERALTGARSLADVPERYRAALERAHRELADEQARP